MLCVWSNLVTNGIVHRDNSHRAQICFNSTVIEKLIQMTCIAMHCAICISMCSVYTEHFKFSHLELNHSYEIC